MDQFDRGSVIHFTANFLDTDGLSVLPDSANLNINYITADGTRTTTPIVMVLHTTDGGWIADWESDVAFPGIVYWSAQATDPHAGEDGSFELTANAANPNP